MQLLCPQFQTARPVVTPLMVDPAWVLLPPGLQIGIFNHVSYLDAFVVVWAFVRRG